MEQTIGVGVGLFVFTLILTACVWAMVAASRRNHDR